MSKLFSNIDINDYKIIGIHTGGSFIEQTNWGTKIDKEKYHWINSKISLNYDYTYQFTNDIFDNEDEWDDIEENDKRFIATFFNGNSNYNNNGYAYDNFWTCIECQYTYNPSGIKLYEIIHLRIKFILIL